MAGAAEGGTAVPSPPGDILSQIAATVCNNNHATTSIDGAEHCLNPGIMAKDIPIMSARWQYQPAILLQINWLIGQGKICFQSNTLSTKDQAIKQADAFWAIQPAEIDAESRLPQVHQTHPQSRYTPLAPFLFLLRYGNDIIFLVLLTSHWRNPH
ncbi:MAG: hypothetical protein IPM76_23095 [Chloroflexi bacterium]|nr:hypothetical protein [Chloroflexota bacterium]